MTIAGMSNRLLVNSAPGNHAGADVWRVLVCSLAVSGVVVWATPSSAADTQAPSKQECSKKYVEAQRLRADGKLVDASEALLVCAQDACPAVLQRDCVQWLGEVRGAMPTVVVGVRDASGKDISNASVTVDGRVIDNALDGRAVQVDPGKRTIHIEVDGWKPIEQQVVIRQGEKNRLLTFQMADKVKNDAGSSESGGSTDAAAAVDVSSNGAGGQKTWAYVAGGLGIVGLGVGGYFAYAASDQWGIRDDHCSNSVCDQTAVDASDAAHRDALIADISLAVGVVGLGVGTYLWLSDDSGQSEDSTAQGSSVRATVGTNGSGPSLVVSGSW